MLAAMGASIREGMEANTSRMENGMKDEMEKMRGEMQQMGHGLQAGIMAFATEVRTTAGKMATPRAVTNEQPEVRKLLAFHQ